MNGIPLYSMRSRRAMLRWAWSFRAMLCWARPSRARIWCLMIGAMLPLTACKRGPDFVPPETPAPAEFRSELPAGESVANVSWWDLYQDPALQDLIRAGLENNRSVREAFCENDPPDMAFSLDVHFARHRFQSTKGRTSSTGC